MMAPDGFETVGCNFLLSAVPLVWTWGKVLYNYPRLIHQQRYVHLLALNVKYEIRPVIDG